MAPARPARQWPAVVAAGSAAAWLAVVPAAVRAQATDAVPQAASAESGGIVDGYSRWMFSFNQRFYDGLDAVGAWVWGEEPAAAPTATPAPPDPAAGGARNVVANLINEPLTAISSVAIGEFGNALRSVQRFGINSTVGILGYYDTAAQWGYTPTHTDIGLSLCRAGVGEYGYVVLPFVGPRTGRDAVADVGLMNLMLWTFAGLATGTGASIQTILLAEALEVVADVAATRQFDIEAKNLDLRDYEAMRAAYLAQRRARCAELAKTAAP
jgi:phospholipid-binding lipoprotein MlaA